MEECAVCMIGMASPIMSVGFPCEEHENPADFLLDTLNTCEREASSLDLVQANPQVEDERGVAPQPSSPVDLAGSYLHSEQYKSLKQTLDPILKSAREEDRLKGVAGQVGRKLGRQSQYVTSFFWQV